jgi:hypothetical protein
MVRDIDAFMEEKRQEREDRYNKFMSTCLEKITDGDLVYRALALFIAKRFEVEIPSYGDMDGAVYVVLNHYVENVDEDFETWLNKDDGPMIRPMRELRKIFPEFDFLETDSDVIATANKIYGLDIDYVEDYFFSLSFDFNSFVPIDVKEIHTLKEDKKILEKYGISTDEVDEKLNSFELDPEILEAI